MRAAPMRAVLATVLIVSVCSCLHPAQPDKEAGTGTPGQNRIAIGDAMDDVAKRIVAAGGENYRFVGVIDYPLSSWFILKDGTCLQVAPATTSEAGGEVVGKLTIGKLGRGYAGWEQWKRQSREVGYVDLQ